MKNRVHKSHKTVRRYETVYIRHNRSDLNALRFTRTWLVLSAVVLSLFQAALLRGQTCGAVSPTAGSNSPVFTNNPLNLTSTGNSAYTWSWTGPNGFTSTSQNPTLTPTSTAASGTYNVTVTSILGANLNTGGDFTGGTIGTMSTGYTLTTNGNTNGGYMIGTTGSAGSPVYGNACTSGGTSGGNMMIVNGKNDGTSTVIQKTGLATTVGSQYRFSFWYSDILNASNPAQLEVTINGAVQTTLNLTTNCSWQQYTFVFTAAAATASIKIVDKRTSLLGSGDVFALDDLYLQEIIPCSVTASTNVVVNEPLKAGGVDGAKLWLKANAGITKTGANVTTWADQSQAGFITTQATKAATANVTHVASSINYNPSVLFDGTANQRLAGLASSTFSAPASYFVVAKMTNTTQNAVSAPFSTSGTATTYGLGTMVYTTGGLFYTVDAANAGPSNSANSSDLTSTVTQPRLIRSTYASNSTTNSTLYLDGGVLGESFTGTGVTVTPNATFEIGGRTGGGYTARIFKGDISEVIYFPSVLNATDLEKVESYLALKYGITLGANASTTAKYVNSDGTTIWAANSGYHRDVAGIGLDLLSDLDQRQSTSVHTNTLVSMANTAFAVDNASNTNSFSTNKSCLIWGHDGGATTYSLLAGSGLQVLGRKWRSEETGTIGAAKLRVPNSIVTLAAGEKLVLIASSDATISTSDTRIDMTLNGSNYECDYNFPTGVSYFTFAKVFSSEAGLCADGIDNDADGQVDCADSDCAVTGKTPAIRH